MKKLTSLQILALMSLSVGSTQLFGKQMDALEEQAEQLQDNLEKVSPQSADKLEEELEDLYDHDQDLENVERIVNKTNKEINKLKPNNVKEADIARIAIKLAKAQKELDDISQECSKKPHSKYEKRIQRIKDELMKAEQGLKRLNDKHDALAIDDKIEDRKTKVEKRKQAPKKKSKKVKEQKIKQQDDNVMIQEDNSDEGLGLGLLSDEQRTKLRNRFAAKTRNADE